MCHVANAQQRQAMVQRTLDTYGGRIDILVSNAAVNPAAGPLMDASEDAIDKVLDINIKAALLLVQAVGEHMTRGGAIVLVTSVTAYKWAHAALPAAGQSGDAVPARHHTCIRLIASEPAEERPLRPPAARPHPSACTR